MNDDDWGNEILGVDDWMSILSENVCLRGLGLVWGEILSFLWMRCGIWEVSATLDGDISIACHRISGMPAMLVPKMQPCSCMCL